MQMQIAKQILLLSFCLVLRAAWADPHVELSVDNNSASMEDTIQLRVTIQDASGTEAPQIENINDFNVGGSGTSSQTSFINGSVSRSTVFSYSLSPKKMGVFRVGPAVAEIDGKTYQSGTVEIKVTKSVSPNGGATSSPNSNFKSEAFVDNKTPYVGQDILFTYRFYSKGRVEQARLGLPDFTGFSKEPADKERDYTKVINGIQWHVSEVRYVLIPNSAGLLTIPPTTLQGAVVVPSQRRQEDVDSFFEEPFFGFNHGMLKPFLVTTESIPVQVQPLPTQGKPTDFTGLVGTFSISSNLSKSSVAVGDSTTLSVEIEGKGNIRDATLPPLNWPHFKMYDDKPVLKVSGEGGKIEGTKSFKKALVPLQAGKEVLPPIPLSYFDVTEKKYKTISTKEQTLQVTPGTDSGQLTHVSGQQEETAKKDIQVQGEDLMPIKRLASAKSSLTATEEKFAFASLALFPMLFGLSTYLERRKRKLLGNAGFVRRSKAYKQFVTTLDKNPEKQTYDELSLIFRDYLGNRFNLDGRALTPLDAEKKLIVHKIEPGLIIQIRELLAECERGGYSGGHISEEARTSLKAKLVQAVKESREGEESVKQLLAFLLSSLFVQCTLANPIETNDTKNLFIQGNTAYEAGNYEAAIQSYENAIKTGEVNGALYYNLGNAYYREKDIGRAIFAFRKAARELPRDPDVGYNLNYARKKAVDQVDEKEGSSIFNSVFAFTLKEGVVALVFFSFWFWALATVRIYFKKSWVEWAFRFSIVAFIGSALMLGVRYRLDQPFGVVVAQETQVYSGMGKDNVRLFNLHAGTEFVVSDTTSPEWVQIQLADGKKGWAKKTDILF